MELVKSLNNVLCCLTMIKMHNTLCVLHLLIYNEKFYFRYFSLDKYEAHNSLWTCITKFD
jgi:hypothetical protein